MDRDTALARTDQGDGACLLDQRGGVLGLLLGLALAKEDAQPVPESAQLG